MNEPCDPDWVWGVVGWPFFECVCCTKRCQLIASIFRLRRLSSIFDRRLLWSLLRRCWIRSYFQTKWIKWWSNKRQDWGQEVRTVGSKRGKTLWWYNLVSAATRRNVRKTERRWEHGQHYCVELSAQIRAIFLNHNCTTETRYLHVNCHLAGGFWWLINTRVFLALSFVYLRFESEVFLRIVW